MATAGPTPAGTLAARIAAVAAVSVAALLVALHGLKPELAPSWRFLSEYAIGRHGWVMRLAFLLWAAGVAALAYALRGEVRTRGGRAGVVVLWVVACALPVAGAFPQDPITSRPEEATTSGALHAIASLIGIPGIPLAAMLVSGSLWRSNPAWAPHRVGIMAAAHATWISLALMIAYLAWAVPRAGGFNAQVYAGWMNRLVVVTYLAWQLAMAWRLLALRRA